MDSLVEFNGKFIDGLSFCSMAYKLFDKIKNSNDGASRLRRRPSKVEKRLLEEIFPIAKYVQENYRPGRHIAVCWIDGSQQFDAELLQEGDYVTNNYCPSQVYLEVTSAVHPKEHMMRELLDTKGGAFGLDGINRLKNGDIESLPVSYTNGDFIERDCRIVLKELYKKSGKKYPENTILIIQATLSMLYSEKEWVELIRIVGNSIPSNQFREIYIYEPVRHYSHTFLPQADECTTMQ